MQALSQLSNVVNCLLKNPIFNNLKSKDFNELTTTVKRVPSRRPDKDANMDIQNRKPSSRENSGFRARVTSIEIDNRNLSAFLISKNSSANSFFSVFEQY